MRRVKAFFFVCAGVFLLALAYHFGATSATAQAPGNPLVAVSGDYVYTANGDVYQNTGSWQFVWRGNVFGSAPVSSQTMSMGQLKAKYATPRPTE